MEPGGGGVGRQKEEVGQVVAEGEASRLHVENAGDEDDTVEGHAALDQVAGQPRRAKGAVALADQEEGQAPAPVAGEVEADELADRPDVLVDLAILLGEVLTHGAAIAGVDRVD